MATFVVAMFYDWLACIMVVLHCFVSSLVYIRIYIRLPALSNPSTVSMEQWMYVETCSSSGRDNQLM